MEPDYVKLKEIKPALSGYIRESQELLKASVVPDEDVVHDVRVLMKKSRAALKLVAPQIDKEYFDRNMFAFREVGRCLSTWRDTSVHRKALKELRKNFPDIFSLLHNNEKLTDLLRKSEPLSEQSDDMKAELDKIDDLLNKAGFRIRFETMNKIDPQVLLKELEVTYNMVVNIYLKCRNNPKPKNLHMFRKKSKDFWYQLWFFRPLNPSVVKQLEKKIDNMTQNLGKYNDLTQLILALDYEYVKNSSQPAMDELIIKIREAQDKYLAKVWPVAYEIFCPGQKLVNVLGFKLLVI
jgi:CHAD domain-containing protein